MSLVIQILDIVSVAAFVVLSSRYFYLAWRFERHFEDELPELAAEYRREHRWIVGPLPLFSICRFEDIPDDAQLRLLDRKALLSVVFAVLIPLGLHCIALLLHRKG